tara:strand:- start:605 stop:805 length:201 start_codon:yes stop_codon:yes gene_type:complete
MKQNKLLNDTLEEQLRIQLVELQKQNTYLQNQISILERCVKEEQDGKYEAYKRIHALNDELKKEKV